MDLAAGFRDTAAPLRLASHRLDLRAQALCDAGGHAVALRPQAMALLCHLVANAGRVVGKDELFAVVWPKVVVTEDSLVQCVGDIRRALGEDGARVVRTVPRRGYLVPAEAVAPAVDAPAAASATLSTAPTGSPAPRAAVAATSQPVPSRPPWLSRTAAVLAAGAAVLAGVLGWSAWRAQPPPAPVAAAERASIAVLAFRPESQQPGGAELGMGLASELITDLARNVDIRVISRDSSFSVGEGLSSSEKAKLLGVRYLVAGSVGERADHLRIDVQLIDGGDGRIVWAHSARVTAAEVTSAREALLERIAGTLHQSLQTSQRSSVLRGPPPDLDAYTHALRAFAFKHRFNAEGIRAGRAEAERAIELDPKHAPGWLYLAWINHVDNVGRMTGTRTPIDEVLRMMEHSIALDAQQPDAFNALATALAVANRPREALQATQRAVELGPSNADSLLFHGKALVENGRIDEGLARIEAALDLYPIRPAYVHGFHARALWAAGQPARAVDEATECLRKAPAWLPCRYDRLVAYHDLQQHDAARAEAAAILKQAPAVRASQLGDYLSGVPALVTRRVAAGVAAGLPP